MINKKQGIGRIWYLKTLLLLTTMMFPALVFCQNAVKLSVADPNANADTVSPPRPYEQLDLKDWLQNKHWIKKKPPSKSFLVIIPVISSNPVAGLIYGAGLSYAYNTSPSDQRLSTISSNASYSTNDLLNVGVRTNIFTGHEKWVFNGDWRYLATVETTYGLGTDRASNGYINLNGYNTANDSKGQTLQYNQIRFHEMASREVSADFFAGLGFQYDRYTDIKDDFLSSGGDTVSSYNYKYSKEHGFNPTNYTTSGLCLNLIFDNRDNSIDAYKGYYANINYQVTTTALGSTKNAASGQNTLGFYLNVQEAF